MLIIIYTIYNKLYGATLHPQISPFKIPRPVYTTHPLSAHQTRFVFRNPLLSTPPHKIQLALRQHWKFLTRSPLIPRCPRTCSGCSVLSECLPGVSTIKFRHRIFRPLTRLCHQVELLKDSWSKCEGRYLKEDFDSYTKIQNGNSSPPNGSLSFHRVHRLRSKLARLKASFSRSHA